VVWRAVDSVRRPPFRSVARGVRCGSLQITGTNPTLTANPFVGGKNSDNDTPASNAAATTIAGYGLWNGQGAPTPNPATSYPQDTNNPGPDGVPTPLAAAATQTPPPASIAAVNHPQATASPAASATQTQPSASSAAVTLPQPPASSATVTQPMAATGASASGGGHHKHHKRHARHQNRKRRVEHRRQGTSSSSA